MQGSNREYNFSYLDVSSSDYNKEEEEIEISSQQTTKLPCLLDQRSLILPFETVPLRLFGENARTLFEENKVIALVYCSLSHNMTELHLKGCSVVYVKSFRVTDTYVDAVLLGLKACSVLDIETSIETSEHLMYCKVTCQWASSFSQFC